jgi:hypothetical protein
MTLTEEERRRYEEEKKLGVDAEEEQSRTGGGRSTGQPDQHYSSASRHRVESHHGGGRGRGGGVRVENERGRIDSYRGSAGGWDNDGKGRDEDRRAGSGLEISAGGTEAGAAGGSRTYSSRNFSAMWSENGEVPRRYSNYSYSNWTSGRDVSGVGSAAYGRGSHETTSSHHSSSSSSDSRHGYGRQGASSADLDSAGSTGSVRHHSWSSGGTEDSDNVGRGYQGAGYSAGGTHFTFSTETSDISDNIGARYQSSHLYNAGRSGLAEGIDNRTGFQEHQMWSTRDNAQSGANRFNSELEESARGSGGLRNYIWTPEISGDTVGRHEISSSGLDSARGHIGRNSHIGIETDIAAVGRQGYSGSGSSQYGVVGGGEEARRQHSSSHSGGSYTWSTIDRGVTQSYDLDNNRDYDAWKRGHDAYGTHRDNVDYSAHSGGSGTHGAGGSVGIRQHYSSSNLGYGDGAGQYGSGGSRQYSSHYESGTSWSSGDRTVTENKLEGNNDESAGQLKLYRKYRHHSTVEDDRKERPSRQRRNVDDAELEQATRCNVTKCSKMRCVLGPMAKGGEVKFAFRFLVWAKTLKSVSSIVLISYICYMSSSDYVVSDGRIIDELLIGKDMEGSSCSLVVGSFPALAWSDSEKT